MSPDELIEASRDLLEKITYFGELSKYADQTPKCIEKLLAHIDSLARQIDALNAGWEDDRAKVIMLIEKIQLVANDPDWKHKGLSKKFEDCQAQAKAEVSSQLVAEHPDLFRGLTKMMADSEKGARP